MWTGTRTLVTGARGFLGQHVMQKLTSLGADPVGVGSADADLTRGDEAQRLFADVRPTVVVHCAVQGGGIGWMRAHPVESGRDNSLINIHRSLPIHHHVAAEHFACGEHASIKATRSPLYDMYISI